MENSVQHTEQQPGPPLAAGAGPPGAMTALYAATQSSVSRAIVSVGVAAGPRLWRDDERAGRTWCVARLSGGPTTTTRARGARGLEGGGGRVSRRLLPPECPS